MAEALGVLNPIPPVIMVAGTNGKGSTTATIAAIYHAAGYRTGLYQSPHILKFNERIRINQQMATNQALIEAFQAVEHARLQCNLTLSFFEMTTLAAFWLFQQAQLDVWIVEVGLGGRLDVVNLLDADVAVLTNVGLDHTEWLGNTLAKIGFEKAGIFRAQKPVVLGSEMLPSTVQQQASDLNCPTFTIGRDYAWYQADQNAWFWTDHAVTLTLSVGQLALVNQATAIMAVRVGPLPVEAEAIKQGVAQAMLPGRFQMVNWQGKKLILDVAHNEHGAEFLRSQLHRQGSDQAIAVFSMLADKDIASVIGQLRDQMSHWHIAPLDGPRAASRRQLQEAFDAAHIKNFSWHDSLPAALSAAQKMAGEQPIVAFGSFHVIEALAQHDTELAQQIFK